MPQTANGPRCQSLNGLLSQAAVDSEGRRLFNLLFDPVEIGDALTDVFE